jgi:hypothetical protein
VSDFDSLSPNHFVVPGTRPVRSVAYGPEPRPQATRSRVETVVVSLVRLIALDVATELRSASARGASTALSTSD